MPLPFFKRTKTEALPPEADAPFPGDEGAVVHAARVRARRRLIGAVVLLAAGVIGFPVLFETQPRPLPVDIPIKVAASGTSGAVTPAPAAPSPSRPSARPVLSPPADMGNEAAPAAAGTAAPAVAENAAPAAAAVASAAASAGKRAVDEPARTSAKAEPPKLAAESKVAQADPARAVPPDAPKVAAAAPPRASATESPAKPPAADKPKATASAAAGAAAKADAAASAPRTGRFVVQVGAFTDAAALRDARQRVEKLGFKSYTQVVETPAGARTRVRVGPFDTREEAERAGARLKSGGLPANLLTL